MVYQTVVKHLIFCAHTTPAPVPSNMGRRVLRNVEAAGSSANIAFWSAWTPGQHSLIRAEGLRFVAFTLSFSTGKTHCLIHRAMEMARQKQKVLFLIMNFECKVKTLVQIVIELMVKSVDKLVRDCLTVDYLNIDDSSIPADVIPRIRCTLAGTPAPAHSLMIWSCL
jgi:hypothetical protein